jgi:ribosome-associated protein
MWENPRLCVNFCFNAMTSPIQTIKLDQFLKWVGVASTGGEAKLMIQDGDVTVNGIIETRRGRKLVEGDLVSVQGETYKVGTQL